MKRIIILLTFLYTAFGAACAEDSGWYLYLWNDTSNSGEDVGQFQTTSQDGVFLLEGITTTESGLKYCIHNRSWSTSYGWSKDEEGIVKEIGIDVPLGLTTSASGWIGLEAGTYNITFNINAPTIRFDEQMPILPDLGSDYLRGGDVSMLNYVESFGAKFYDFNGKQKDPLDIMQENGVNIVRLRLYNDPGKSVTYTVDNTTYTHRLPSGYLNETDILKLARRARKKGMRIELTLHYSDFWTNGDMQFKPKAWENCTFAQLKDSVYTYTRIFLQKMTAQGTVPDYVSIGNEIQGGILFGHSNNIDATGGHYSNMSNLATLLKEGSKAVREVCPDAKVVIHLTLNQSTGYNQYQWLFDNLKNKGYTDYDIIGASYYPYWTNQKPTILNSLANSLYNRYSKPLMIMETGYSWTQYRPSGRYSGNYEGQLHLNGSAYNEASEEGQKAFLQELQAVIKGNSHILGYLYWDPLMVEQKVQSNWIETAWAWKYDKSYDTWWQDGNMVGNATWFDYEGKALPIFEAIKEDVVKTLRGDANGDGEITMDDATSVVNYIIGTPTESFNEKNADANLDGEVSMQDVMFIVQYILNSKFPKE